MTIIKNSTLSDQELELRRLYKPVLNTEELRVLAYAKVLEKPDIEGKFEPFERLILKTSSGYRQTKTKSFIRDFESVVSLIGIPVTITVLERETDIDGKKIKYPTLSIG